MNMGSLEITVDLIFFWKRIFSITRNGSVIVDIKSAYKKRGIYLKEILNLFIHNNRNMFLNEYVAILVWVTIFHVSSLFLLNKILPRK